MAALALFAFLGGAVAGELAADKNLPEVTIEAQRRTLHHQVHSFVYDLTFREDTVDSLARWQHPICPLVAGMPVEQGEAVLARLSQIAGAVRAPLGPRDCKPNFRVVLTSEPEALLEKWWHRDRFIFGRIPPPNGAQPIQQFIHSTRPIRVWYNTDIIGNSGETPSDSSFLLGGKGTEYQGVPVVRSGKSPHMSWDALLMLSSVIIVVDARQVKGYSVGQIADYVAMVGLTQVNQDFKPEAAPSIMRLFAASSPAEPRPEGMSSWDQAFLKGLYTTDQGSLWQRGQIVSWVVQDLAPP